MRPLIASALLVVIPWACGRLNFEDAGADGSTPDGGPKSDGPMDARTMDRVAPLDMGPRDGGEGFGCVRQIVANGDHACALRTDGMVLCWGSNGQGNLGDGTFVDRALPVEVGFLPPVARISNGEYSTCAATAAGAVYCWGGNAWGQVGDGTTTDRPTPIEVTAVSGIVAMSNGERHTCAIGGTGAAWCWGHNNAGQLGDGTTTDRVLPVPSPNLTGALRITVGDVQTCAIAPDRTIWCWGQNDAGQLGDGTFASSTAPRRVTPLTGAQDIAAGCHEHTCAVLDDGSVWCWGNNEYGQVGDGTTTNRPTPVRVDGVTDAVQVSVGAFHTCARTSGGTVWCWGLNDAGQIGDGSVAPSTMPRPPTAVPFFSSGGAVDLQAACGCTCALHEDGAVWCWGNNDNGSLGDGTFEDRPLPVRVLLGC